MGFEAIANYFRRKPQGQREPWDEKVVIDGVPTHITNIGLPRRMRELVNQYPNVGVGSDNEDDSSNVFSAIRPPSENFTRQNPDVITPPNPPTGAETIGTFERPRRAAPVTDEPVITPKPSAFTPVATDTISRPRTVNEPAPEYDSTQSAIRQRWVSPINQESTHNAITRDAYEHPPKAHGWQRFAPVLEGFARGVQSTGSLAGGIGGAATGLGISAFDPKAGNRLKYGRELAESDQRLATISKQRQAQLDEAVKTAGLHKTVAETADILDRPTRERAKDAAVLTREDRVRGEVERHNKVMETLQGTSREDSQKRALEIERHNKAMETIGRLQVKAATLRGNEGRVTAQAWREYNAQKHDIDKENQRVEKEYTEAQQAAEAYNKKHDELDKFYAALQTTKQAADKAYYQNQINTLHAQLQTLGNSLRDKYAKQGYIRYSDEERWIAGDRPEPKEYPDAPELSFSEGPEVVSEEDGEGTETPAPRRSGRARKTTDSGPRGDDNKIPRSNFQEKMRKHGLK